MQVTIPLSFIFTQEQDSTHEALSGLLGIKIYLTHCKCVICDDDNGMLCLISFDIMVGDYICEHRDR